MTAQRAGDAYPVNFDAEYPQQSSRLLALLGLLYIKFLLLIPHFIVLIFLGIAAGILAWVGYIVTLFTGRLPQGFHAFITGVLRWQTRTTAWLYGLTDRYPPFRLEDPPAVGAGFAARLPTYGSPAVPPPPPPTH